VFGINREEFVRSIHKEAAQRDMVEALRELAKVKKNKITKQIIKFSF
jgi:hypothetical protein